MSILEEDFFKLANEQYALYPQDGKLNLATDKYSDGIRRRVAEEALLGLLCGD